VSLGTSDHRYTSSMSLRATVAISRLNWHENKSARKCGRLLDEGKEKLAVEFTPDHARQSQQSGA
jgi:hypothetical protein